MSYENVIKQRIEYLQNYRSEGTWQYCLGNHETPAALQDTSVIWEEMPPSFMCIEDMDYWFKREYVVPQEVKGIPVQGTSFKLSFLVVAFSEVFIDGNEVFSERFFSDFKNPEVIISDCGKPGETHEILIHMKNNQVMNSTGFPFSVIIDIEKIEDIIFDLDTFIYEMHYCSQFTELSDIYNAACSYADANINESTSIDDIQAVIRYARKIMEPAAACTKEYTVHLIGHAHIDMNWVWDMEDTIDVCRRDFSTMAQLMTENPDFTFSQSQISVYEIAEKHFPELFEKMKYYVEKGNWDITAATWTEGDLNMSDGEAVARHLLYSKKYLLERFGKTSRVCWEPDTFGQSANLPQVFKKSGVDYYYHVRNEEGSPLWPTKLSPLYFWEGLDGSRMLAFRSKYGYTDYIRADRIAEVSTTMKTKHRVKDSMHVYGVGDHGGGPSRRDIRRAKFLNSLPTMPKIKFSTTHEFYDTVSQQSPLNLDIKKGEVNTIFDGCYSSHSDIKRYNRKCEGRLLEAEASSTLAGFYGKSYNEELIATGWKGVLFNQFHDILDGCAAQATYETANRELEDILQQSSGLTKNNLQYLSSKIKTTGSGIPFAIWNLQGFSRRDVAEIALPAEIKNCSISDITGQDVPCQILNGKVYFIADAVPSMGYKVYYMTPVDCVCDYRKPDETESVIKLETDNLQMEIDKASGCIVAIYDKDVQKHIVHSRHLYWYEKKPVYNNILRVDYEAPHGMIAWVAGMVSRTENLIRGAKVTIKSTGLVADVIEVVHTHSNSTITQQIFVYKHLKRIDFKTYVDWQEVSDKNTDAPALRVSFMPEIKADSCVTYDIPYGNLERIADGKEVPGMKWVDVSDDEYGFSLLNDCKYGFSAVGNQITMTCIRTSYAPDPVPEKGQHEFNYALYPHQGGWRNANTVQEAAGFNSPLIPVSIEKADTTYMPEAYSWLSVEGEGILLSSFKKSIYDDTIILRCYETRGQKSEMKVRFTNKVKNVEEISIAEDQTYASILIEDGGFTDQLGKYEIKTYRISF